MSSYRSMAVTLETVTPLFLAGAEPRAEPELRPPAFRGVLRYWFRAAAGGVIGDQNLAGLHRLESSIFGDTTRASPVVLRLGPIEGSWVPERVSILPHRSGGAQRLALPAERRFQLRLQTRPGARPEVWQAACATVALAVTCGGVGLRSRRGYGTLRVVESSDSVLIRPFPSTLQAWVQHVEGVTGGTVAAVRALARAEGVPSVALPQGPTSYPCASRTGLLRLAESDGATTPKDAVVALMNRLPKDAPLGGIRPRQASPLWARPVLADGRYYLLLTLLASKLAGRTDYPAARESLRRSFPGQDLIVPGWNE